MKVLFLTIGTNIIASSRTRVYQYFPYLEENGIEYYALPYASVMKKEKQFVLSKIIKRRYDQMIKFVKIILFLILSIRYDLLFIQKVLLPIWLQRFIHLINPNIIYDFDDLIYLSPPNSPSSSSSPSQISIRRKKLANIIKSSKYVILENDYTKDFALQFNKNILMITGPIDCRRYFPKEKHESENLVIGWIGSPWTSIYLNPLFTVLRKISRKYPSVVVELIGASNAEIEGANIRIKEWALDTEVKNLQNFDIGIMFLPDDEWSRGKGGYKLLQYMAVGIPCVASPVGINCKLIVEGVNGFLAGSEDEWYQKLELLINARLLRKRMGKNGRKIAEEEYSFEIAAPRLIEVIKKSRMAKRDVN